MKKIVLTLFIIIVMVGAIFYLFSSIDTDSSRDTFEYFLSGLGEKDMEQLKPN